MRGSISPKDILDVIDVIIDSQKNSYSINRDIIKGVFANTEPTYTREDIILRLTVINSLYSTNAKYAYFTIEDMADVILSLGTSSDANDYFYKIAMGEHDTKGLYSNKYGIDKAANPGIKMPSLMSKYAYYCLLGKSNYPLGFPIYDSLSRKMSIKVTKALGNTPEVTKVTSFEDHLKNLDNLRKYVFIGSGNNLYQNIQQFDLLDAYLWRMGKIEEGNLSLLLNKKEYKKFVACISPYTPHKNIFKKLNASKCLNKNLIPLVNHWNLL